MSHSSYFDRKREFTPRETKHIELMRAVAKAVSQTTGENFVLKGGTALLLAYGLNRFSTDLDFDGKNSSVDIIHTIKESTLEADFIIKDFHIKNRLLPHVDILYITKARISH